MFVLQSQQILRFEPALLPVEPDVEAVVFSYGFPSNVEFSELTEEDLEVPVVIDTPYNVIGVGPCRHRYTIQCDRGRSPSS